MHIEATSLLINLAFGVICALIANSRGRSAPAWFLLGALLTCLALILVLVLPDLKAEELRHHRLSRENRRLREMIRSDRQMADSRYEESNRRLSVHDQALGVDTSPRLPDSAPDNQLPDVPAAPDVLAEYEKAEWYFVRDEERIGPMPFSELRDRWRGGEIGATTFVWAAFMSDWEYLGDVQGLEGALRA